ncbi:hypothetical protein N8T08_001729 [Aspergillus melleus]|uniref:Uncharacterized protein n=1 Tax=Aspergillus melleus TaxID=138277 RepID=A0ACC3AND1_9EURO|nr:hypothetical protein N8T08_001729 [Aspergillus melleus]
MVMHVSVDEARGRVSFNVSVTNDYGHPPSFSPSEIRLPGNSCDSHGTLSVGWPQSTVMNGSVNNDSLELTVEGAIWGYTNYFNYVGIQDTFNVMFTVTFNGTFDSVNSTRTLQIQPGNATLARASNRESHVWTFNRSWGVLWAGRSI